MKFFKKKSDDLINTIADSTTGSNSRNAASIVVISSTLAFLSFYLYKKFRKIKTIKKDNNIIIHTTKLDD
ncbi:MAG: hypothetical protein ACRCWG_14495 [Sarcina sp.]